MSIQLLQNKMLKKPDGTLRVHGGGEWDMRVESDVRHRF